MQLKRLYIHNYKSFYDTTIELGKFNIVVGENNSGKSNLIDVLEFIDIYQSNSFEQALQAKGGFEKILNYNTQEDEPIIISCDFEDKDFFIKSKFTIKKQVRTLTVIIYATINSDILPLHVTSSRYNQTLDLGSNKSFSYEKNYLKLSIIMRTKLLAMRINFKFAYLSKSYAFNTQTIRNESQKKSTSELQKDGANLGKNLFELKQNNPNSFEIISNSMITTVNEIDSIDVQETFGNYLIGFEETNKMIGMDMVSDGTINLLATVTALNQHKDNNILLAFDEPERYLHLKAVNYLLEEFRANEKQILITTHSTEILKNANLDELIFIYRDSDGDTQSIRADEIPHLEEKMQRLGYERPMTMDELIGCRIVGDFE